MTYSSTILDNWDRFVHLIDPTNTEAVCVNGVSLDLASIAAVARYGKGVALSQDGIDQVLKSADDIAARVEAGETIYAVNTGVGASADTRTTAVEDLQQAIIKTLNCGIADDATRGHESNADYGNLLDLPPARDGETLEMLPPAWAKAAQLVRANALMGGDSGIRVELLQCLVQLLQHDIVPNIPLRGSISASGDLSPLAYLAGAIQGNPGIKVWTGTGEDRKLTSSDVALKEAGIAPVCFAPKEALALANGTSVSAAAAALMMHEAHSAVVLAQALTAMAVEGLNGTDESFDPYLAEVRPHPGQIEAAQNVRHFLHGSKLARRAHTENANGLCQDRYSLRTAPQWMGPELETMALAHSQVVQECNSITDNPIVKPDGTVLQGGNFQALHVTSAMDKARSALHTLGRMIFQQATELMNPATNHGLPPNLTADEPSCDFLLKGMDIASASYQSELGFLAHGTVPFVQVAECGNQALNSMALMSARYTQKALDVYFQLSANCLLAVCQAVDLRVVQRTFEARLAPLFRANSPFQIHPDGLSPEQAAAIQSNLWTCFTKELRNHTTLDLHDRMAGAMAQVRASAITAALESDGSSVPATFYPALQAWSQSMTEEAVAIHKSTMAAHTWQGTLPLLGAASQRIYRYVRADLDVPFLRGAPLGAQNIHTFRGTAFGTTIGTYTSRIYTALRNGGLVRPVMESLRDAQVAVRSEGAKPEAGAKLEAEMRSRISTKSRHLRPNALPYLRLSTPASMSPAPRPYADQDGLLTPPDNPHSPPRRQRMVKSATSGVLGKRQRRTEADADRAGKGENSVAHQLKRVRVKASAL